MGHPMDDYWDGRRAERDRHWARRDAVEARLAPIPLSAFTFAQFADLQLVADRSAASERWDALEPALTRLEAFLDARDKACAPKPKKPARRRR